MDRRLAVPLAVLTLALAACHAPKAPVTQREARTFPATPDKLVQLDLGPLDVDVRVAESSEIRVETELEARSSSPGAARRWLERNRLEYSDSPARLDVRRAGRDGGLFIVGFLHTEGRVKVTLPPGCRLEVETASGDVTLDGGAALAGTVRVTTASGDVEVRGGSRDLVVKTASGDLSLSGAPLASLEAETASGDVRLRSGAAKTLIDTASGDLQLDDLSGGLSVHTASGDVRARWRHVEAGTQVDVRTTSGDVQLRLPGDAQPAGTLATTSGRIRSDWDGSWGRREKRLTLTAPSGAGAPALSIDTTSGSVTVVKGS